jgi:hypothetical protein
VLFHINCPECGSEYREDGSADSGRRQLRVRQGDRRYQALGCNAGDRAEQQELLRARRCHRWGLAKVFLDSAFQLRDTLESAAPTELQFCRNQTMGWVGGVVLSKRLVRSIAGSLKIAIERLRAHRRGGVFLRAPPPPPLRLLPVRARAEALLRSHRLREGRRTRCSVARRCRASRAGRHSEGRRDRGQYSGRSASDRSVGSGSARPAEPRRACSRGFLRLPLPC